MATHTITIADVSTGADFRTQAERVAKAHSITFEAAAEQLDAHFFARPDRTAEFAAKTTVTPQEFLNRANALAAEKGLSFEAACEQIEASL